MELPNKEVLEIFKELAKPLPKEAIQKTKKEDTRKSYDTTGFGYQWIVNRLNEVLGNAWGFDQKVIKEIEGKYNNGTPYTHIIIETEMWILSPSNIRAMVGGHRSNLYDDAYKGASTNSFKKTAAMFGVGWEAFAGTIDEDNTYGYKDNESSEKEQKDKVETEKKQEFKQETEKQKGQVGRPKKETERKEEKKNETVETKENDNRKETGKDSNNENISGTGEGIEKTFQEIHKRDPLTFEQLKDKMDISKNMYELNARCKKYRPDYDLMDKEQQLFIRVARDKRKVWLTRGEGIYTDLDTKGIDKDYKENK